MIPFIALDPKVIPDHLGLIPFFLSFDDPAPAREQFNANYAHGGGWYPMPGWTLKEDLALIYDEDEDPPLKPIAAAHFNQELILIYPNAWVAIIQPDGSFEVSRMD
jgi:hypothetical protein